MQIGKVLEEFGIDEGLFQLKQSFFDRESHLHGIPHTYRVMTHCLALGMMTGFKRESFLAFCGAFIHDMSRQHDDRCYEHGKWAAQFKLPEHRDRFLESGIIEDELPVIVDIVTAHSQPGDIQSEKKNISLAILKDADALDRIRLGAHGLNPQFLRLEHSHLLIESAERLYMETRYTNTTKLSKYISLISRELISN